ncbi:DnaJ like chaperone protein [Pseudomonas guineae]|uniref:DnaJ like chaperone protein n=1 Tax=Pseudomonas guineae TaxID=425504 RepID=A0A1I3N2A0_9PSED|nr:TerB family tellurite resistance protein [Pseudomonas guineae]SFJ03140.1 DnaJ like chaperone protein [Pseudomonas guineae]|tara:strand:+ start:1233 stop:1994 length:762 start_codon:yes stop_codon:yes gene_type:complete
MIWPATLLGAVAGLAVASIPGALLGVLLGQVLDRRLRLHSWAALRERLGGRAETRDEWLLFILLGRLAKSGGRVMPAHIQQAQAEMQRLGLDGEGQRQAIAAFAQGKTARYSLRGPLRRQRERSEALLRACWRMAWADGQVDQTERELIMLWGKWLQVSSAAQAQFSDTYAPQRGPLTPTASNTYQHALSLLNVSADAEPAQIKQAYRRLLSRHHPDKLAGSGASPERLREATERTRELHQAYDLVRQRHGFR